MELLVFCLVCLEKEFDYFLNDSLLRLVSEIFWFNYLKIFRNETIFSRHYLKTNKDLEKTL